MNYKTHPLPARCLDWLQLLWIDRVLQSEKQSKFLIILFLVLSRAIGGPDGQSALGCHWGPQIEWVSSFITSAWSFVLLGIIVQRFHISVLVNSCFRLQSEIVIASNNWQAFQFFSYFTIVCLSLHGSCTSLRLLCYKLSLLSSTYTYAQTHKKTQGVHKFSDNSTLQLFTGPWASVVRFSL